MSKEYHLTSDRLPERDDIDLWFNMVEDLGGEWGCHSLEQGWYDPATDDWYIITISKMDKTKCKVTAWAVDDDACYEYDDEESGRS